MRIGLFGLPGAGKGTQSGRLAKHFRIPHISTGDMFRELQSSSSEIAREIQAILASGQLVPDHLVTEMTFERLAESDCQVGFILDGYPRTLRQAEALQGSPFALNALICVDVLRDEIIRRLSGRRVCPQCKSIFAFEELQGNLCPRDGALLVQRPDDSIEAINTRLTVFENNFLPVMNFFEEKGLLYRVDGNGSADMVFFASDKTDR